MARHRRRVEPPGRRVYVFDHLGYGLSEKHEGQDLTLAAQGRRFAELLRRHHEVFAQLPAYAHEALVTAHLRHATHQGYRPGVLEHYRAPWLGAEGQAAFYRQYRQLAESDTADYEHLLGDIDIPLTLLWGRNDSILPPPYGEWIEKRTSNSGITWIDGAGHLLPEDAPAQLLAQLSRT